MRVRHPFSFFLVIAAIVVTSSLTVAFNMIHVAGLLLDICLLIGVRLLAHHEARRET